MELFVIGMFGVVSQLLIRGVFFLIATRLYRSGSRFGIEPKWHLGHFFDN